MLRRTNVFLDSKILKELEVIGKGMGLKKAQVIRVALAEFVRARKAMRTLRQIGGKKNEVPVSCGEV